MNPAQVLTLTGSSDYRVTVRWGNDLVDLGSSNQSEKKNTSHLRKCQFEQLSFCTGKTVSQWAGFWLDSGSSAIIANASHWVIIIPPFISWMSRDWLELHYSGCWTFAACIVANMSHLEFGSHLLEWGSSPYCINLCVVNTRLSPPGFFCLSSLCFADRSCAWECFKNYAVQFGQRK